MGKFNRRDFLRTSLIGGVAAGLIRPSGLMAAVGGDGSRY